MWHSDLKFSRKDDGDDYLKFPRNEDGTHNLKLLRKYDGAGYLKFSRKGCGNFCVLSKFLQDRFAVGYVQPVTNQETAWKAPLQSK